MNKNPKNKDPLMEDPDFTVEEISPGDVAVKLETGPPSENEEKEAPFGFGKVILALFLAALMICVSLFGLSGKGRRKETPTPPAAQESGESVSVTEAPKDEEETLAAAGDKAEEILPEKETDREAETEKTNAWQEVIFGPAGTNVVTYPVRVFGLTENEKNLLSFRESDFIRSLSSFLSTNNMEVSSVTFTGPIACSPQGAAAYTASLKGEENYHLVVLFYPDFPGKYLFALEKVEKEKEPETVKQTEKQRQPERPVIIQTQPSQVQAPAEAETQSSYDAMSLTLTGLSGELANYVSNTYELQYGLYDYLYQRGIKSARKASVTSYYIDPDEKKATIQIDIAGIGSVTAIYDRDRNSYTFQ